jgi:ribosomal protein S18 acetylase RimI-like enzyme
MLTRLCGSIANPSRSSLRIGALHAMLLLTAYRQQGVGRKMYQAFEQWAIQHGAQHIGLGVVEQNKHAYFFWQRLGFEEQEKRPPRRYGNKENVIIVMKRSLKGKA